jgi:Domain of unknown function (DUF5134)
MATPVAPLLLAVTVNSAARPRTGLSAVLAAYFGLAAIPWFVRATGPGPRLRDRAAAGHAAMSTGMTVLLLAML